MGKVKEEIFGIVQDVVDSGYDISGVANTHGYTVSQVEDIMRNFGPDSDSGMDYDPTEEEMYDTEQGWTTDAAAYDYSGTLDEDIPF